jgi:serine/threonine protein kinase
MEYIDGGELFDFIVANPRIPERTCRRIFRQIVSALDYCHQSSIIHRGLFFQEILFEFDVKLNLLDLKPENLLMDIHKNVKLVDFGFVNIFENENTLNTFCGSPYYASPGNSVL